SARWGKSAARKAGEDTDAGWSYNPLLTASLPSRKELAMTPYRWPTILSLVLAASTSWAQDVTSGPEKGAVGPALPVFDATGPQKGKDVDYAAESGDRPTVYVFIQADKWDRPMARFLKRLDGAVQKEGDETSVVGVWLTDDPTKTKEYLPVAQQSLQ